MLGLFLSIFIAVTHWFWGRKLEGWAAEFWDFLALPLALGLWIVLPFSGFSAAGFGFAWLIGLVFAVGLHKIGLFKRSNGGREVVRGTEIITAKEAIKWLKTNKALDDCEAKIGEIPIPVLVETTNFLMAGAPGSGKSLAFFQLLDSARKRAHRAIVADLGGEFITRYFRPNKDLILNPFDQRTVHWSPFAEMRQSFDATRLAASMIPEGVGESKEWNGYARAVLEGILERCFETDRATNEALVYYALGAGTKELAELCQGTPAAVYFAEGNERQLGSIRGILAAYIKPLTYLRPNAGRDAFSVRSWVESTDDQWLFISFKKDHLDSLRAMITAQIDVAASTILSADAELGRRLWFSLDEFAQLGEIRQLESLLNLGRKYGVAAILGMQGMTQPAMVFGRERAQAILSGLGTWTVFRQGDAESAEYMSKFLGDEEIRRTVQSESKNKDSTSNTNAEQIVRQRAIMPGELQQMSQRRAIVNVAGPLPPAWTDIPLPPAPAMAQQPPKGIEDFQVKPMVVRAPEAVPAIAAEPIPPAATAVFEV